MAVSVSLVYGKCALRQVCLKKHNGYVRLLQMNNPESTQSCTNNSLYCRMYVNSVAIIASFYIKEYLP